MIDRSIDLPIGDIADLFCVPIQKGIELLCA